MLYACSPSYIAIVCQVAIVIFHFEGVKTTGRKTALFQTLKDNMSTSVALTKGNQYPVIAY